MRRNNEQGIALVATLFILVILIGFSASFIMRTVSESNLSKVERESVKSLYLSEAGTQTALKQVYTLINNNLQNTILGTNPSTIITKANTYVASSDGVGFLVYFTKNAGTALLTLNGTQAEYTLNATNLGSGTYNYKIIFTEKSDPTAVSSDIWDFPYYYRIESTGISKGEDKKVVLSGDFTVRVRRDNFARYALFTNSQAMPNGTNVWFTDKTSFDGPMHTNDRYNIYGNPSGVFNGTVTQVQSTARYYNNGFPVLLNDNHNSTIDVPTFNSSFTRGASAITLSSSVQQQDMVDQADAGNTYSSDGIYVPTSSGALTGGIYVKGNSTISLSVDGSNNAVYTITQGSTTKNITVNRSTNQTTVQTVSGSTVTYNGKPDGVDQVGTLIYVNGAITALSGTVQEDTQVTISAKNNITISNHLRYANYNAASGTPGASGYVPPSATGYDKNLLGLVTWDGDVRIGSTAPNNVDVHATVLAQDGIFQVDNYDSGSPRGTATVLGGVITNAYGAFGQFNSSTGAQTSGYGRNFVYDTRMENGSAPPYFPSLNTFIAFTNDITDKMVWQEI